MTKGFIIGVLFSSVAFGCSGKSSTGGSGGSGTAGSTVGTGGSATGTGGAAVGTGGASTGTGGTSTGTGGGASGGTVGAGGGTAGATGTGGVSGTGGGAGRAGTGGAAGSAAGRAGTAGTVGSGGAGGAVAATGSVLERNNHPSRDGHFLQPTLTKARAATMAKDTGFTGAFTVAMPAPSEPMWASPLYLESGPGGKGVFFAVTTGNDVIALDETTGAVVWKHNIGSTAQSSGAGCGNIHPIGILSTPVIDAATGTIYVAGAIGTTSITRHEVHALSVMDGTEKAGWPVNVSAMTAGTLAFNTMPQNQRSALSLVAGVLYVAYGGHNGDCGTYHGWVVGINVANPTMRGAWATGGVGEGIWQAGGMASDGVGVFTSTGNSTNGTSTHLDSEEIVRITGLGTLDRTNANLFFPTTWRTMDQTDADFSSINPVYVELPGATPSTIVVAIAKDGHMYLLDSKNLGGMGGQKTDTILATVNNSMAIHTVPAAYTTAQGLHVVLSTDGGAVCPAGMPSGKVVMSVLIPVGAPPAPRVVWCAALAGTPTGPVATTTNGTADAIVWFMNNGKLTGVDGDTGAVVYAGGATADSCSGVQHWTSPIAVKGRIIVGGDGHLCSWSPH